jgi:hypothetical protein
MNMTDHDHAAVGRLLKARWRGLASRANLEKAGRGYWVLPAGTTVDMVPELVRAWVFAGLALSEIPRAFAIFEARLVTAWGKRLIERIEARPSVELGGTEEKEALQ